MDLANRPYRSPWRLTIDDMIAGRFFTAELGKAWGKSVIVLLLIFALDKALSGLLGGNQALSYLYFLPIWLSIKLGGGRAGACTAGFTAFFLTLRSDLAQPFLGFMFHVTAISLLVLLFHFTEQRITTANRLAETDGLTGLLNHMGFLRAARDAVNRAQKERLRGQIILFDCDKFKAINDTYGHSAGDEALRAISSAIRENLQAGDLAGRLGGDEFAVFLNESEPLGANLFLARVRNGVELASRRLGFTPTLSAGSAECGQDAVTIEGLLQLADKDMFRHKAASKGLALVEDRRGSYSAF